MTATARGADTREVVLYDAPPTRRSFSPADVVRLLLGALLVIGGGVLAAVAQATIRGIERDLLSAFARLPDRLETLVLGLAQLATSLVPLVVLVVLLVKRRWKVALLLLLATIAASLAMLLADALIIDRDLAAALETLRANDQTLAGRGYPDSNVIASTTAVVTVAAPWLSRRWKRALWGSVTVLILLRMLAVTEPAFDLVLALGVGTVVGSAILLLFGSPANEPKPFEMLAALRRAGFDPRTIRAPRSDRGALRYEFDDRDGRAYDVKLRTADERDAELLSRVYRGLRYRSSEVSEPYSTLKQRLEHEALMMALARQGAVRVPRVETVGTTEGGSAFVVSGHVDHRPVTTDDLARAGFLADLWSQVGRLQDAGLAHRRLALEAIGIDDDGLAWLADFDRSQTAPPERERARDIAQLLVETGAVVGARPAVAAAVEAVGTDRVAPALRMLQPLALPSTTRQRSKQVPGLLDELRTVVNEATGEPDIAPERLERIRPRTALIIGVSTLAFYSLLPQLANFGDTLDAFGSARPLWLLAALAASVATYLFAAVSFQGAVAAPIPFAPNLRAQVAASFAGLVGPAGAGGFALTARFLERVGVGGAEATASVAVNAIAGFVVHLSLMLAFFVWAGTASIGGFSLPESHILLLGVAVAFALVGILVAIRPVRRRVLAPIWESVRTGAAEIGRVFRSPARVGQLFGGSTAISLAYVGAAAACVEAFGGGLTLPQIGSAYLGAMAIATLAPTPGGLGAVESAMIAGFTGFGLGGGAAVSATLTFRLATFWLPMLPGWFSLGWMQRTDEL